MPRAVKLAHVSEDFHHPYRRGADPHGSTPQPWTSVPQQPPAPQQSPAPQRHPFEFVEPYRWTADPYGPTPQPWTPAPQRYLVPQRPPVPPASTIPTPAPPHGEPPNPASTLSPFPSPTPGLPPLTLSTPSLSSTPSSQPQNFHAREMFRNAQGFIMHNPQFIDASHGGSGLERLLRYSMPGAFHDSGARYPPPKCHLGTRNDYIDLITNWALETSDRKEAILWMHGPFGVGKSAVAQSCAEALEAMNKLAATLFFSRSNSDRDDPQCVFTSIAYQIATICPSFGEIVNRRMIDHPALATKSLTKQFEDLLVQPLSQVDITENGLAGRVMIIDGLDECRGTAEQCEIIRIIAASVDKRTTPFRWFITSRPEDAIIRTMNSTAISTICSHIELPVSREIDHEILVYLTDEFNVIRNDHGLPESWPSEEALALLVERGAGLWIYVSTIVRFIKDENSLGPKDQLCIVLKFAKEVSAKVGPDNPLAEMDFFYTLIMQQIPLKVRTTVRKILLAHSTWSETPFRIAAVLCLSAEQLRRACASVQSVMELQGSNLNSMRIKFYHASFLDFMNDPQRSRDLCIQSDFLIGCRRELLGWLYSVCSRSTGNCPVLPSDTILPEGISDARYYEFVLAWFWRLSAIPEHPFDSQAAMCFAWLPFRNMLRLLDNSIGWSIVCYRIRDNLPAERRDKITRQGKCPIPGCTNTQDVWILGHGENEVVPGQLKHGIGFVVKKNDQNRRKDGCICGAWDADRLRRGSEN
ncbi:hypothetical protein D9756_011205 [Leucocoprinus leucothites]|uniref:Nephrocystin 3-like N-terminal domain-containing protein n=1 Tax=Leucocoprinus leucothites TaxID=201217 RepID=A0A8H5CQ83_9AGAR|nr:hypothetical protein D9756_011205 [Leucoagaricus leucothites]